MNSTENTEKPSEINPEKPKDDPSGIVSSGQKARSADVMEALAAVRALQDAQRKESAEADELQHNQNK